MRKFQYGAKYLCKIGVPKSNNEPSVEVGIWDGYSFTFSNGCYSRTEICWHTDTNPYITNAIRVLSAKIIKD